MLRSTAQARVTSQLNQSAYDNTKTRLPAMSENTERRAARKRLQAQYRALYDEVVDILFEIIRLASTFTTTQRSSSPKDQYPGATPRRPLCRGCRKHHPNRS